MKNILFISTILFTVVMNSCKNDTPKTGEAAEVAEVSAESIVYALDTLESLANWTGNKIVGEGHYGTIKLMSGSFSAKGNLLESGNFVADMNTISSADITDDTEKKSKLEGHLKDVDFLDVAKYPTAKFEVSSVKKIEGDYNTEITGNLTVKDVTKSISFKANTEVTDSTFAIYSEKFDVNRKEFNIVYDGVGENALQANMQLSVSLKGKK